MKIICGYRFPETPKEALDWKPKVYRVALSRRVLVIGRTRIEGKWSAYIDAVPGEDHDEEEEEVLRLGTRLLEKVARVLFPSFDGLPYAS